jgi:hypothetical protein
MLVPLALTLKTHNTASAFTVAGDVWVGISGVAVSNMPIALVDTAWSGVLVADAYAVPSYTASYGTTYTSMENQPLVIQMNTTPTGGDANVTFTVVYAAIPTP